MKKEAQVIMLPIKNSWNRKEVKKIISYINKNYNYSKGFYYMKGDFEKKNKLSIDEIINNWIKENL